jgi:uncharacterized protein (TIGR03067 family)
MHRHLFLLALAIGLSGGVQHSRSAEAGKDEAAKKLIAALQGKWQMTSRIQDGVASEKKLIKYRTMTFEGDKFTLRDGDKVYGKVAYKINAAKKPAWIDTRFIDPDTGSDEGIIKVEGDTMTMCLGYGNGRPDKFESEEGDGRILAVYKRVKK